jgi:uncharacterized membrane protein (DUF485 family)
MAEALHTDAPALDWAAIERLPEFRELVAGRRRFAWTAGAIGIGTGALYVVLAATAHGLMGTRIAGSFTLGFAGGVGLILMTWAITLAYMRRSAREWAPLEARVREQVLGRADARAAARRERFERREPAAVGTPEVTR